MMTRPTHRARLCLLICLAALRAEASDTNTPSDPAFGDLGTRLGDTGAELAAPGTAVSGPATLAPVLVEAAGGEGSAWDKLKALDHARDSLLPPEGATATQMDRGALDALPQGKDTAIDKALLQLPGVSYDSAASNPAFHVRNEYANVQYRINGIQLPDGVSGLGPVLETGFVGNLRLLDGALPAQYGWRTAGVVDITTPEEFMPGGTAGLYTGSLATVSPSVDYGGTSGRSQYFVTGRYLQDEDGLESATPGHTPIHDSTRQGKLFGYGSTLLSDTQRLTYIAGAAVSHFQIPDVTGLAPLGDYGPTNLSSTSLNETEDDSFVFAIVALQTHGADYDTQISAFTRYAAVHFIPDVAGDLAFNDVAANVGRRSQLSGVQFDGAWRVSQVHTLRAGFAVSGEQTQVDNQSTVLPLDASGNPLPTPIGLDDHRRRLGWTYGAYVQDAWSLSPGLTLDAGLRFDLMDQFVVASQFSPRAALVYQANEATRIHLGYARYFTPPMQAQATPTQLALFAQTSQQPTIARDDPVRPERADYLDLGIERTLGPGLKASLDAYYKRTTDQLDDGQFGQAVVLTEFNYARGFSDGLEARLAYQNESLRCYANVSLGQSQVTQPSSNQYLFTDPVQYAYQQTHYVYTSDTQLLTVSAGASYRYERGLISLDTLHGSGLRSGDDNLQHVPAYTQWNLAATREIASWSPGDPATLRVAIVNLFDHGYLLRSGDGIGEFAPQYGPRRSLYLSVTQPF